MTDDLIIVSRADYDASFIFTLWIMMKSLVKLILAYLWIMKERSVTCSNCEERFDPIACRWRCPHCGYKEHCCD